MSVPYEQLALDGLLQIGAATAHAQLDSVAQQAAAGHWSYSHFLGRLLEPEIAARRQRVVDTSLHFSGLPWLKRLSDFDFAFQPSIDRTLIEAAHNLRCGRIRTVFAVVIPSARVGLVIAALFCFLVLAPLGNLPVFVHMGGVPSGGGCNRTAGEGERNQRRTGEVRRTGGSGQREWAREFFNISAHTRDCSGILLDEAHAFAK